VENVLGFIRDGRRNILFQVFRTKKETSCLHLGDTSQPIVVNGFAFSFEQFFRNFEFQNQVRTVVENEELLPDCAVVFPRNQQDGAYHLMVVRKDVRKED
jgi:hypothetical protein